MRAATGDEKKRYNMKITSETKVEFVEERSFMY